MAGLVGYALTAGGLTGALVAFGVAAMMIVALLFGLSLAIGTAQERLVQTLHTGAAQVKHWGGAILILVGLWLIMLAIWADTFAQAFPV